MNNILTVTIACKFSGLRVDYRDEGYFQVHNSIDLLDEFVSDLVQKILSKLKLTYIPSANRIGQKFVFTIHPLPVPMEFAKIEYNEVKMTREELQRSIEEAKTDAVEGQPVIIEGEQRYDSPLDGRNKIALRCDKLFYFAVEFFEKLTGRGAVLDLGCGTGINSAPMLKKGWSVFAVDHYEEVFKEYKKYALENVDQLHLIHKDINEYEYPENTFNLVIAANVLNYVDNKKLIPLISKIYKTLQPGGKFMGDLWFEEPEKPVFAAGGLRKIGAYMYRQNTATALLVHSGFSIEKCVPRYDDGTELMSVQFVAKKD